MDHDVLTFDVARRLQTRAERIHQMLGLYWRAGAEKPDHWQCLLLRARRKRPRNRCAAEQRDEIAPLHSITSSARPSSVSGKVMPSALAALRLMTSSTFVTCWTGRSNGFSPLRIRPG